MLGCAGRQDGCGVISDKRDVIQLANPIIRCFITIKILAGSTLPASDLRIEFLRCFHVALLDLQHT